MSKDFEVIWKDLTSNAVRVVRDNKTRSSSIKSPVVEREDDIGRQIQVLERSI